MPVRASDHFAEMVGKTVLQKMSLRRRLQSHTTGARTPPGSATFPGGVSTEIIYLGIIPMAENAGPYPMQTIAEARRSLYQAVVDCRAGKISPETYKQVRERLNARIVELGTQAK